MGLETLRDACRCVAAGDLGRAGLPFRMLLPGVRLRIPPYPGVSRRLRSSSFGHAVVLVGFCGVLLFLSFRVSSVTFFGELSLAFLEMFFVSFAAALMKSEKSLAPGSETRPLEIVRKRECNGTYRFSQS